MQFRVNTKQRGDTFGEVSLMYNVPRSATVAATKESLVWVLERDTFRSADLCTCLAEQCSSGREVSTEKRGANSVLYMSQGPMHLYDSAVLC